MGGRAPAGFRLTFEALGPRYQTCVPNSPGGNVWFLAVGAFLTGAFIARVIDWRAHAHPRL